MALTLPTWISSPKFNKKEYLKTKTIIENYNLTTVCIEANCPNRYECFARKTATFMILGDICTRHCRYCNIKSGIPKEIDLDEPERIAKAVVKLNLDYVVITSVTRDDLMDGGAQQFIATIEAIRKRKPGCKIEILIPDLKGNWPSLKKIIDAKPDILNHNVEVVKELFPKLRPEGSYDTSFLLLKKVKEFDSSITTKSGFMVGFGETIKQITNTLKDLKKVGCDIVTIGQYLPPSSHHYKVRKFYSPEEFSKIKMIARNIGIKNIIAGPLVRSSYKAKEVFKGL